MAIGTGIGLGFNNKRKLDDMTYPVQTIDLTAEVEYDLTTTIGSTHEIYNVLLEDSSGNDITTDHTIRWAVVSSVWHIYIYSVDSLSGVKVKIIYK